MTETKTVAALSSGLVPSGVAVIRVSGPRARFALETISGPVPGPRKLSLRRLTDPKSGEVLDQALVAFFRGPASFTGEDVAEIHCHGGQAVVSGVLGALYGLEGVQAAEAGDFTRQAFLNGKLDLTQVEGIGDLISATTAEQRRQALDQVDGVARQAVERWAEELLMLRARIEANLDFSDEDDVDDLDREAIATSLRVLGSELSASLEETVSERLRDGFRVVLVGAPNSGKSTLLNALVRREAALVSPIAGTTRDALDIPIDINGIPVLLTDTAGLRDERLEAADAVEAAGIARARERLSSADLVLALVPMDVDAEAFDHLSGDFAGVWIRVRSKCDLGLETVRAESRQGAIRCRDEVRVSGQTGYGLDSLKDKIAEELSARLSELSGSVASIALDERRRVAVAKALGSVREAELLVQRRGEEELLAEELRAASAALSTIVGSSGVEDVLDRLFSRFCLGK
ncbi:MAG: tRNA uridine-5-carboxymethylaminomethyl(34) synthesis GTPase MnmE [Devosiaceae bacterium]|nr:tRNA uridine-5-carboxymethylaminomethyl(34) synthesis GTPase MnmE [Devosiaceae bacterium MH13]